MSGFARALTKIAKYPLVLGSAWLLATAGAAHGGCSTSLSGGSSFNNKTWIVGSYSASLSAYSGAISAGMNMWNTSCGSMSGNNYPGFGLSSEGALREGAVSFTLASGHAATTECGSSRNLYCAGTFDTSSSTVTIYSDFGDPASLSHFADLSSHSQALLFAHELGHGLGLADDNCAGGLMNGVFPPDASISGDECSMADQLNHVPYEGTPNQGCLSLQDCHQSPIVLNLGEDGYQLTGLEDPVWFDIQGEGIPRKMGWTARGAEEAFLWRDLNGNGIVDDGRELFGSVDAANGFEALKSAEQAAENDGVARDDEGVLTPSDPLWKDLRLWIDANHDGICQPWEVFRLEDKGIVEIGLRYRRSGKTDRHGNALRYEATVKISRDGSMVRRSFYDVYFVVAPR